MPTDRGARTSTSGQVLGERGQATRQKILDAIVRLIEQRGLRDLKLVDVTRECGITPPAFYQYFKDLDEALWAICDDVGKHFGRYRDLVADSWGAAETTAHGANQFVERYLAFWDDNRRNLRVQNALRQEPGRFSTMRVLTTLPFVNELMAKIAVGQANGDIDPTIKPMALATALMALADQMGAIYPDVMQWLSLEREDLIAAVGYIFDRTISGGTSSTDR